MQVEVVLDGKVPFRNSSTGPVNDVWNKNAQDLYDLIMKDVNDPKKTPQQCFARVGLESTEFIPKTGYFEIKSMTGTITTLTIKFTDNTSEVITSGSQSNSVKLLDKENKALSINNIKKGTRVYIKSTKTIKEISGIVTCKAYTGWVVNLEKWTNRDKAEQSFIRAVVKVNNKEVKDSFKIGVKTGSIEIRKQGITKWDEKNLKAENPVALSASYKIYCVNNEKWIKGDANGVKTYVDEIEDASIYKTNVNKGKIMSITINNLTAGYRYNIYEVDVDGEEYKDSRGSPRIADVAWSYSDEIGDDKTWRRDDGQTDLLSWDDGERGIPGFGGVYVSLTDRLKEVTVRNIIVPKEEIGITINKKDNKTNQLINGVELQLYKKDNGWLDGIAKGDKDYIEDYSSAGTYVTGIDGDSENDGKISLKNLTVGTYYIYESNTKLPYDLNYQRTKYPDSADPNKFAGKDEYANIVYLGQIELKEEDKGKTIDNITYNQYALNTKLTILKKDGTLENVPLSGTKIKIFVDGHGWIKKNENMPYRYEIYENATEFITDNDGKIELENVPYETYYIFETEVANKKYYNIKEQDGYHKTEDEQGNPIPGINEFPENADWVYLGNATIKESAEEIQFNAKNEAYVSLKGKVWIDNPDGKANNINNIYDPNGGDELLNRAITVNLYSNKDGKNELIATTTTGENGEYEFKNKTNGEKLTYWELAYCYVEFVYDNKEYITVVPFEGENLEINSKAQEKEITSTGGENNMGELYDGNLSGTEGEFPGKAVTYQGNVSSLNLQTIENNKTANQSQRLLTGFYNEDTYTIENINLGLVKKLEPSFSVGQQIEYVKIVRGNYSFTYKMRR